MVNNPQIKLQTPIIFVSFLQQGTTIRALPPQFFLFGGWIENHVRYVRLMKKERLCATFSVKGIGIQLFLNFVNPTQF